MKSIVAGILLIVWWALTPVLFVCTLGMIMEIWGDVTYKLFDVFD